MPRSELATYNLLATFGDLDAARSAMAALERHGVDGDDISLLGPAPAEADREDTSDRDGALSRQVLKGTATGGGIGTIAGGLAGVAAFAIPGVGPFIGTGILAGVLAGAVGGGAVGGVAGGVSQLQTGEDWELTHADMREGRSVVAVHADNRHDLDRAADALKSCTPLRLEHFGARGERLDF
jgi:hypothetical protein